MTLRLLSFAVWALVSASAVFWASRLLAKPTPAPAHAVTAGQTLASASADLSRVLGVTRANQPAAAAPEVAALSSRFKLVGVVAAKSAPSQSGLALIAIDGKPPRPVGLGGVVDGELVLQAVNHRRAEIGPSGGDASVTLELPAVPEANRSVRLPSAPAPVQPAAPGAAPPPAPMPSVPSPPVPGVSRRSPETR